MRTKIWESGTQLRKSAKKENKERKKRKEKRDGRKKKKKGKKSKRRAKERQGDKKDRKQQKEKRVGKKHVLPINCSCEIQINILYSYVNIWNLIDFVWFWHSERERERERALTILLKYGSDPYSLVIVMEHFTFYEILIYIFTKGLEGALYL